MAVASLHDLLSMITTLLHGAIKLHQVGHLPVENQRLGSLSRRPPSKSNAFMNHSDPAEGMDFDTVPCCKALMDMDINFGGEGCALGLCACTHYSSGISRAMDSELKLGAPEDDEPKDQEMTVAEQKPAAQERLGHDDDGKMAVDLCYTLRDCN